MQNVFEVILLKDYYIVPGQVEWSYLGLCNECSSHM